MELHTFPFDSQLCELALESFGYSERNIALEWSQMPLEISSDISVPQFSIKSIEFEKLVRMTSRGNISSLIVTFNFVRDVGFYLLQIYLPSFLIVLTSFTAFWIDPAAVPARVTISVFTTLIMANMSFSLRKQLPLVSYIKAIDVWNLACMVFVFLTLVEYALINVILRRKAKGFFTLSMLRSAIAGAPIKLVTRQSHVDRRLIDLNKPLPNNHMVKQMQMVEMAETAHSSAASSPDEMFKKTQLLRRRQAIFFPPDISSESSLSNDSLYKPGAKSIENLSRMPPIMPANRIFTPIDDGKNFDDSINDEESCPYANEDEDGSYFKNSIESQEEIERSNAKQLSAMSLPLSSSQTDDVDLIDVIIHRVRHWPCFRKISHLSGGKLADYIEAKCRYIFPLGFGLFNGLYWFLYTYLLQMDDHHEE